MKIVFDTNILYSAFVKDSHKIALMLDWIMNHHTAMISEFIAAETIRITNTKAPRSLASVSSFLQSSKLTYISSRSSTSTQYPFINDPKDQPILNASIDHDVDIIITGDKHFHALDIERPRMMYPADFIAEYMDL